MNRTELLSSIQCLQLKKENLIQELASLDLHLKSQQAQYSRLLNDDTIVYRLPSELLTGIFVMCTKTSTKRLTGQSRTSPATPPFQVVASHVSHRWREIALGNPLLWNTLTFNVRRHSNGHMISQLEAHFERSGSCFLDITLDFHFFEALGVYCQLLAKHSRRWRRLSILTKFGETNEIHKILREADAPMLEHLSLHLGRPPPDSFSPRQQLPSVTPSILPFCPPSLSFVRLAGHALGNLHPPTSSLTTLHLEGWTRHYMTHEQFRTILEGASSLINLSLNQLCLHHPRDPLAIVEPTTLPSLRALRIRGSCSPVSQLVSLLNMPQLDSVALEGVQTFDSQVMPTVRSLILNDCEFEEQDISNMMSSLPSLCDLSIDESLPDIFFVLVPEGVRRSTEQMPWSQLQTITIRNIHSMDVPYFCNMVYLRQTGGSSSLRRICLDRRSRSVLQSKGRLEWLREKITVENADIPAPWPNGLQYEDVHDLLE